MEEQEASPKQKKALICVSHVLAIGSLFHLLPKEIVFVILNFITQVLPKGVSAFKWNNSVPGCTLNNVRGIEYDERHKHIIVADNSHVIITFDRTGKYISHLGKLNTSSGNPSHFNT